MSGFRINETKIRDMVEQSGTKKVRVHPEGACYYAGVVIFHDGKWDEKALAVVRNHSQDKPFEVCFGGFCSLDYCEEVGKEVTA